MRDLIEIMEAQRNNSYYSDEELCNIGFASIGKHILISKLVRIYGANKIHLGSFVRIDDFAILSGAIRIGNYVHIAAFASITGGDGISSSIELGDFCGMSSYSKIFSTTDDFSGGYLVGPCVPTMLRNVKGSHIVLEKHCHIGSHSLVLPKSYFSIGASLGPMSLNMGRKLKPWSYYFGNPAKKIYDIDSTKILEKEAQIFGS